jgi:hypothetical protein
MILLRIIGAVMLGLAGFFETMFSLPNFIISFLFIIGGLTLIRESYQIEFLE